MNISSTQKMFAITLLLIFAIFSGACDDDKPKNALINVYQGNMQIENTVGVYDFGSFDFSSTLPTIEFTIKNTGDGKLNLTGTPKIEITGTDPASFVVDDSATSSSIVTDVSTTFSIKFNPNTSGNKVATVSIPNNDKINNPFTFTVTGYIEPIYLWTRSINMTDDGDIRASTIDANNNAYFAGKYTQYDNSGIDFGADFGVTDIKKCERTASFVTKILADGSYGWTRQIVNPLTTYSHTHIFDIVTDSQENLYVIGSYIHEVDFGADFGVTDVHVSQNRDDLFIMKITATGDYGWTKTIGNLQSVYGTAIACDSSDNIYFSCTFPETIDVGAPFGTSDVRTAIDRSDAILTKIDHNGDYVWTKQIESDGDVWIREISFDNQDNIYFAGNFNGNCDFGKSFGSSDAKTSLGYRDLFVSKVTYDGLYCWTKMIGWTKVEFRYNSIAIDSKQNILLGGCFTDTVNFGADFGQIDVRTAIPPADPYSSLNTDYFIMKINSDGSYGWVRQFGNEYLDYQYNVVVDSYDSIFVSGSFRDQLDFGKDFGIRDVNKIPDDTYKIFLTKIDPDGSYCWSKCVEEHNGGVNLDTMTIDSNNKIYITGAYGGTVDFGKPFNATDVKTLKDNKGALYILKLQD